MLTVYQGAAAFKDPAANLTRLDRIAAAAAAGGGSTLVMPELFLTGYNLKDSARDLAAPADGAMVGEVAAIAARYGITVVVGFPERDGRACHNSVVVAGPDGGKLALYRKIHLFGGDEAAVFTPGQQLQLVDLPIGRAGLAICYDIEFPEVARALTRAGAEIIVVPTANMAPHWDVPTTLVRARALENGVAVVYANLVGTEGALTYTGLSAVVGPDGRDLARAGANAETHLAVAAADLRPDGAPVSSQLADLRPDALRVAGPAA